MAFFSEAAAKTTTVELDACAKAGAPPSAIVSMSPAIAARRDQVLTGVIQDSEGFVMRLRTIMPSDTVPPAAIHRRFWHVARASADRDGWLRGRRGFGR